MAGLNRMSGILTLMVFAASVGASAAQAAPAPGGAQTADKGAAVYVAQKCSLCHSLDGKGNAKGPLDGVGLKWSADEIRQWIVTPAEMGAKAQATRKPAMKAFPSLPKEDLDALVAFLHARKKK